MRLTKQQQQTLRAAVDRIIPPDDYPGAWQSGVGDYLARQFEGDLRPVLDGLLHRPNSARSGICRTLSAKL